MTADISYVNGKAECFTALTPAWWDKENDYVSDSYLTSDEVWGDRGLLNFEYEMLPVFDQAGEPINGYFRTARKDTGVTVGCGMTKRYKLVQPRQAFEWMDSLMQDGIMKYASAGVLKGGRVIWILSVIPDAEETPIQGERHDKYVLWTDRFDGCGSLNWFPCATRVECANTLSLAMGEREGSYCGIRHTGDMDRKLESARQAIVDAKQAFACYNAHSLLLMEKECSRDDAKSFVEDLFPQPGIDATPRKRTIRERKVQAVRDAIQHPTNNLGGMPGTYGQLLNAVTFAIDHGQVFRFRGRGQDRRENRFVSLMVGDGAKLKRKAFNLAVSMAT